MNNTYLTPSRYTFTISGSRFVNFQSNIVSFSLPAVDVDSAVQSTPKMNIPRSGSKIKYGDLTLSIIIDGSMSNYAALYDWLRDSIDSDTEEEYDLSITIYNISEQPIKRVRFRNTFVSNIGDIEFNSNQGSDGFLTFTATFKYTYFDLLSV